jgi:hypothetical protein
VLVVKESPTTPIQGLERRLVVARGEAGDHLVEVCPGAKAAWFARGEYHTAYGRVALYLTRLSKVTGHPISLSDAQPNFWVYIASVDDRAALGPELSAQIPGLTPGQMQSVTQMDAGTYCQVLTQSNSATSGYVRAAAVIPSEHPDLMRLACIHEELAQSLGLPNDSNAARPSIFNDDQEFALLTYQDELMLQILYDPALSPGMTRAQAQPIVETLATALLGGETAAQTGVKR